MHLYELAAAYRETMALCDETGGEVTPEIQAKLDAIEDGIESKADAIAALVREARLDSLAAKEERDRLAARQRSASNREDRLREYLKEILVATGLDSIKTKRFNVRVSKSGTPAIAWNGEGDIPADFTRVRTELDGNKVRDAYKAGALPEGFTTTFATFLDIR